MAAYVLLRHRGLKWEGAYLTLCCDVRRRWRRDLSIAILTPGEAIDLS